MKLKHYLCVCLAAAAAGLLFWSTVGGGLPPAHAGAGFTNASVKGNFGFSYESSMVAGFGLLTADGNGGITGVETVNVLGGGVVSRQFNGQYIVNADGTGSIIIQYLGIPATDDEGEDAAMQGAANFSFVLVDGGRELRAVRTDAGAIVSTVFRQQ